MIGADTIIDLSHWNPIISFADMKAGGIQTVIHKCTQGLRPDPEYADRAAKTTAAGLLFGSYHFGIGSVSAQAQAEAFLSIAKSKVLALDWEWNRDQMVGSQAAAFVQIVHDRTGRWPLLYTSAAFLAEHFKTPDVKEGPLPIFDSRPLLNCDLWLTGFTSSPKLPSDWLNWKIWQHGIEETPGVIGKCDRDTFNGTPDELVAYFS